MARVAAPLALLLAVVVVFAVVSGSTGEEGSGEQQGRAEQPREGKKQKQKQKDPKRRTYVVEEGDSLSSIAVRFGLTIEEIIALNEDVDPQALSTGQELKLK